MSEELLKIALQEACEKEFSFFEKGKKHFFSFEHRRKMKKLLKKDYNIQKATDTKVKIPLKKRFIIVIYVIIFAILLCVGVVAISTNGFRFDKRQDHTETLTINWENAPQYIEYTYYITALPEDYKLINSNVYTTIAIFSFENDDGKFLDFRQMVKKDYHTYINTENHELKEITFNGLNGFFINYEDEVMLVWDNEDYVLELIGNFTKEEMVNLAKSVKLKDF